MDYLIIKSLHIIFIVTWFAGLFYIPRLFIYHTEALQKEEPSRSILADQLRLMSKRLWLIITWPSAILTLFFGISFLWIQPQWLQLPFMHIKLTLVFLLYLYHGSLHVIYRQLQRDIRKYTSYQLRLWNEVATVLLISIVFLIVKKDTLSWIWGTIGIAIVVIILMLATRIYRYFREKKHA